MFSDDAEHSVPAQPSMNESSYKPCYFNSPMTERNLKASRNTPSPKDFKFIKPKVAVQKKRKLHGSDDIMF